MIGLALVTSGCVLGSSGESAKSDDELSYEEYGQAASNCHDFDTMCGDCSLHQGCGYCTSSGSCESGTNDGSTEGSGCSGTDWVWLPTECTDSATPVDPGSCACDSYVQTGVPVCDADCACDVDCVAAPAEPACACDSYETAGACCDFDCGCDADCQSGEPMCE